MMIFILVAILYCCAIFLMRKKYEERKIIKNDYGQRYEYHIFVGDNEFVGYSNYKIKRALDAIYYCDFIKVSRHAIVYREENPEIITVSKKEVEGTRIRVRDRTIINKDCST